MRTIGALAAITMSLVATACVEGDPSNSSSDAGVGVVEVAEVIDGDTLDVRLDGTKERVRIIGINAPERGECLDAQATAALRDLVDGRSVSLVVDTTDRDDFGRLLRYVEVGGTDVGEELVRAGLALARRYPPDVARAEALESAQAAARADGTGLWASDACGPTVAGSAGIEVGALRFDADGNDSENLNDEWIEIVNTGEVAVDLDRWSIRDESSTNRYRFDEFVLPAGATVRIHSGCGTDTATELFWCTSGSAVWNNSGDTVLVLDPAGNVVTSASG